MLRWQSVIQRLIASDSKAAIRENAISSIKFSATADEHIHRLQQNLPDISQVTALTNNLQSLKPKKLEIIKYAKRNKDLEALTVFKEEKEAFDKTIDLSWQILVEEQNRFQEKISAYHENSKKIAIGVFVLAAGLTGLLALLFAFFLAKLLLSSLVDIKGAVGKSANGDCDINLHYDGVDEMGECIKGLQQAVSSTKNIVGNIRQQSSSLNSVSTEVYKVSKIDKEQSESIYSELQKIVGTTQQLDELSNEVNKFLQNCIEQAEVSAESCQVATSNVRSSLSVLRSLRMM